MQYVTSIERRGIQKGIQQGVLQKSRENVGDILDVRFQQVPMPLVQQIQAIDDLSLLSKLHREAIVVPSLEAFEQLVKQAVKKET